MNITNFISNIFSKDKALTSDNTTNPKDICKTCKKEISADWKDRFCSRACRGKYVGICEKCHRERKIRHHLKEDWLCESCIVLKNRQKNYEKFKENRKKYLQREEVKEYYRKYGKKYWKGHKDKMRAIVRDYYNKNKTQINAKKKIKRDSNIEEYRAKRREYYSTHKDIYYKSRKEYLKRKYGSDLVKWKKKQIQ
jgi:hypothetical protein